MRCGQPTQEEGARRGVPLVAAAGQCVLVLMSCGCSGPGPEVDTEAADVADAPLGWGGPVNAAGVRFWPLEALDAAPRWRVAREPDYSMVLDSVELGCGSCDQRPSDSWAKRRHPAGQKSCSPDPYRRFRSQPESPLLYY